MPCFIYWSRAKERERMGRGRERMGRRESPCFSPSPSSGRGGCVVCACWWCTRGVTRAEPRSTPSVGRPGPRSTPR
ncbi:hypothetical protein B484DRAFT_458595 [Ochromonadaceae sp. CCMP2298]|nr:hypothetical protein B484DRAFT_458595 [Ochromonadaceae sp. CCMP2298]